MDKSLSDALSLLESRATSSRAHSAIKTLRSELGGDGSSKPDGPPSPGQRAANRNAPFDRNAGKLAAVARMKAGKR